MLLSAECVAMGLAGSPGPQRFAGVVEI
jgi:hypothetical protein